MASTRLRLDLPSEKLELLQPLGIRQLVLVPFDRASWRPWRRRPSWTRCWWGSSQARRIAVGSNFRFGAGARATRPILARIGADRGIAVTVVPMLCATAMSG
jgi:riboflavin kinase / FMN adenylyltransferase